LAHTKPVVRRPLQSHFGELDVIAMPPPSSGGTTLIESLNLLAAWEKTHPDQTLDKLGHNSPRYLHLLSEAMKHAFADRAEFLGDGDFSAVPVARLIDPRYAAKLAERIDMRKTRPLKDYGRFVGINDSGTSHYSIIDAAGNAVACTETINTTFGSFVVEPRYGIVLNNEMDDLAAMPGQPNVFGLIQSEANAVAPGRKPLSSMSPTIVLRDGKASLALGASGGPRIISSTLQVLLNATRFKMSPAAAIRQPRIHHQWIPNKVFVEEPLFQKVKQSLTERGHDVAKRNALAVSQIVTRTAQGLRAMSDPRKHGRAAGY
jgi:gamma-glutamyltranspeptidase/glutathione hydrolase